MKTKILASIFLISTLSSYSQDTFLIGSKTYPCTSTFQFNSPMGSQGHDLDILIAKNGETGMIVLSTYIMSGGGVRIKGNISIYLDDATVITCIDNGKFDFVDNTATTIYYLTKEEITKIKKSNITKIRFSLKCYGNTVMSGEEGNFTASNSYISISNMGNPATTDVSDLVIELFGE